MAPPMFPVRWGDDDLRAAVASAHSWRGAARALGLRSLSGGAIRTVKRRAAELDLDTSHFTGQRRWTDHQLRKAVANASTWADVVRDLSSTDNAEVRVRLRGHAMRLGLDTLHLSRRPAVEDVHVDALVADKALLSRGGEQLASAWFAVRGASIAKPDHPAPYDLLVTLGGTHHRVQVKTTCSRPSKGTYVVNIGRRPYALDKSASRQPYDPGELDYFFIIDGDLVIYLIPSQVVAGMTKICVGAYRAYRVGDASSLFAGAPKAERNGSEASRAPPL